MPPQKSLFSSLTFWGAFFSWWLAIVPVIKEVNKSGWDADRILDLTTHSALIAITIIGRYNANSVVYTPRYMVGRDKKRID